MENALACRQPAAETGTADSALRLALAEARQLAAQSMLLALNAALEAAAAGADAAVAAEMEACGAAATRTAGAMQQADAAIGALLEQIRLAGALRQPL